MQAVTVGQTVSVTGCTVMLEHPHANSMAPMMGLVGIRPRVPGFFREPLKQIVVCRRGRLTVIPAVIGPSSASRRAAGRGRYGLRGLEGTIRCRHSGCDGCQRDRRCISWWRAFWWTCIFWWYTSWWCTRNTSLSLRQSCHDGAVHTNISEVCPREGLQTPGKEYKSPQEKDGQ